MKVLQAGGEKHAGATFQQTGYKSTWLGNILYGCTMFTFFVWWGYLALWTRRQYLYLQNQEVVEMILVSICALWNLGLLWCLVMHWPQSIRALFLRRCILTEATHVAVYSNTIKSNSGHSSASLWKKMEIEDQYVLIALHRFADHAAVVIRFIMGLVFATDIARPDDAQGILEYCPVMQSEYDGTRYFVFLFRRYNFSRRSKVFVAGEWSVGKTFSEITSKCINKSDRVEMSYETALASQRNKMRSFLKKELDFKLSGLSGKDIDKRLRTVGLNNIDMEEPSFVNEFYNEISKPLYTYQLYILWLWAFIQFWYMSLMLGFVIVVTAAIVAWFRFQGSCVLHGLSRVQGSVTVFRNGTTIRIDQTLLVPGDVVMLAPGKVFCDMLLVKGHVVVDESALTGEATPQVKSPIDPNSNAMYDPILYKRQTLSAGTRIADCERAVALVTKTGSYTSQGELLRELIVLRRHKVQFEQEMPLLVAGIVAISCFYFFYGFLATESSNIFTRWTYGMTVFSTSFPAILPLAFSVPTGISFRRLRNKRIACAISDAIPIAGQVNAVFFDKTGTLTKQGLDFVAGRSAESWELGQWLSDKLQMAMAVCHTLTLANTSGDKNGEAELVGNPVDQAMFIASDAELSSASGSSAVIKDTNMNVLKVVRRFDFDHNRMSQSVIVRLPNGTHVVFVKGSSESIIRMCDPETVPTGFRQQTERGSSQGKYQIVVGWKELTTEKSISSISRDEVEKELQFVGVLDFSNELREASPSVVRELKGADVATVIVTGDDVRTGIHIAQRCGMVETNSTVLFGASDHTVDDVSWTDVDGTFFPDPTESMLVSKEKPIALGLTGEAWQMLLSKDREYAMLIAQYTVVFGRCSPYDKVSVIDSFITEGAITMMCGDGGNDSGALKAAHVGLALSDHDTASMVAPFTCLDKDIVSVLTILQEGRAALASTAACFKLIFMFGQTTSVTQLFMHHFKVFYSYWMATFNDLPFPIPQTLALALAQPATTLAKTRPSASLLSTPSLVSFFGMLVIHVLFMIFGMKLLQAQDWYKCRKWEQNSIDPGSVLLGSDSYESTLLFWMQICQVLITGFAVSLGHEFRRVFYRNYLYLLVAACGAVFMLWVILVPSPLSCLFRMNCENDYVSRGVTSPELIPISNPYAHTVLPMEFRWTMVGYIGLNLAVVVAFEYLINAARRMLAEKKQASKRQEIENRSKAGKQRDLPV